MCIAVLKTKTIDTRKIYFLFKIMEQIVTYLLFSQVMALIICTILQLIVKNKSRINTLMAFLYFLLAYILFYFWLYRSGIIFSFSMLRHSDLAATVMLGPVIYAYLKNITGEKTELSIKSLMPFVPGIMVLVFFIIRNSRIPFDGQVAGSGVSPDYHTDPLIYVVSILADIWLVFYIIFALKRIYLITRSEVFSKVKEIQKMFYLLTGALGGSVLLFPAHFLKNDHLIALSSAITGIFCVIYFLFSYRYPEYTQMTISRPKGKKKPASLLDNIDLSELTEKINTLMKEEHLYRDPSVTLQSFSNELRISSDHLSVFLNDTLGINFRTFINNYRLDEAKKLLSENNEKTILEIAFFVGFNSKSSFNTIFSKTTGYTPTEYRKKFLQ